MKQFPDNIGATYPCGSVYRGRDEFWNNLPREQGQLPEDGHGALTGAFWALVFEAAITLLILAGKWAWRAM